MADMKLHYVIAELHVVIVIFSIIYCCYALINSWILFTCERRVIIICWCWGCISSCICDLGDTFLSY